MMLPAWRQWEPARERYGWWIGVPGALCLATEDRPLWRRQLADYLAAMGWAMSDLYVENAEDTDAFARDLA